MPIAFPPTLYSREPLLSGDAGVEQTINQMRELSDEALHDPAIIRLATDIVRSVPSFDDYAEAKALYDWVHGNIRFTKDPVNKEKLYPPAELLKIRAGDCDDIAMLLGVLLMAVGYPARLVTVAVPGQADQFSHVYAEGEVPAGSGQWVPMDPARYDSEFGVAPPVVTRSRWWSLSDNAYGDLGHLGHYPRFRAHVSGLGLGSYGRVRTMGLGAPPQQSTSDELVSSGYDPSTIQTLIYLGATNEQLQALPYPATPVEMQSAVSALVAQLNATKSAAPAVPGSSTSSTIATIAQGGASLIRAAEGQPASPFDFSASGPWQSFQTQYSPYGVPAGYPAVQPGVSLTSTSNIALWLVLGLGALMVFGGGGGRR